MPRQERYHDLQSFDHANSAAGLLHRYARGRVKAIWLRLSVAAAGVVLLGVFVHWQAALIAMAVTVPAEIAEHLILNHHLRKGPGNFASRRTGRTIAVVSLVQAVGLGVCIAIAGLNGEVLRLTAWVFLIGATLNSLLVARYHPASHHARLAAFSLTACAILFLPGLAPGVPIANRAAEVVAVAVLFYMFRTLFQHLTRREQGVLNAERALIEGSEETRSVNAALKKAQSKLVEREKEARRLALVAQHANDSVVMLDHKARIIWANDKFSEITGYKFAEVEGRSIGAKLNGPLTDQTTVARLIAARNARESFTDYILNYRKDGSTVWMEINQTPLFDENGEFTLFISVERDATKMMEKQAQLQQALAEVKRADQEKSEFLSRMSHELRTPMNGVVGGLDILTDGADPAEFDRTLDILRVSSARMQTIVDDILSYSEISTGVLVARAGKSDLTKMLQTQVAEFRIVAAQKGLSGPKLTLPDSPVPKVWVDARLMRRMIDALLDNAIKFTDQGQIDLTLSCAQMHDGLQVRISVEDTGIGIHPDDQERVFEKFTQADGKNTRCFDGAGLGLSIAQEIAGSMGGKIALSSIPGQGSRFEVTLLLRPVRDAGPAGKTAFLNDPALTLLVAEDNRTNRLLISRMFKNARFRLEFAEDGEQAVEKYIELRPDVVLMDLSMPRKNGLDATRDIRKFEARGNLPECPILALTANAYASDRKDCFDVGMNDFLAKPVKKAALFDAVGQVLKLGVPRESGVP
ncbi:MAG: response regulator [Rhodobacteraceae bacterium]|nr:response regulator [Paracoccaceae bacterium]